MIKEAIEKVVLKKDLTERGMEEVMKEIATRSASDEQIASFITALRMKGETPEEITVAARVIRDKVSRINVGDDVISLDREEITVERETILSTSEGLESGTNIFNVSTATAFVVAGEGLKVAKHVRRSYSPLCGCADVIESLGINLDLTTTQLERCLREVGMCFFYEPMVQNGLGYITTLRRKIGVRTIFNLLDPLINPAGATTQVLGVYEPSLTETIAVVLKNLGTKRAIVVNGEDTLDEISITGKTKITEVIDGRMRSYFIAPEDLGMIRRDVSEIKGGTKRENAEIILEILKGGQGARRDITILNAAATFVIGGRAKDLKEGIEFANRSIDSGEALNKLQKAVKFTNSEPRYLKDTFETETGDIQRNQFQGF